MDDGGRSRHEWTQSKLICDDQLKPQLEYPLFDSSANSLGKMACGAPAAFQRPNDKQRMLELANSQNRSEWPIDLLTGR